jgi:hypothetical protein
VSLELEDAFVPLRLTQSFKAFLPHCRKTEEITCSLAHSCSAELDIRRLKTRIFSAAPSIMRTLATAAHQTSTTAFDKARSCRDNTRLDILPQISLLPAILPGIFFLVRDPIAVKTSPVAHEVTRPLPKSIGPPSCIDILCLVDHLRSRRSLRAFH